MEKDKQFFIKIRAVILHEGKLLLVEHKDNPGYVALPGGHLEWGEDVRECLSREIIEELGVRPDVGRLFYINTFTDKDRHYTEFFFEVKNGVDFLNAEKLTRSHAYEIEQIVWAGPTDGVNIRPKSFADDFKTGKVISDEVRYIKD